MTSGVRPDFSPYVVHFAKAGFVKRRPDLSRLSAIERLASILRVRTIQPTYMPWFGARCAAFTECTWTSLLDHAARYSHYGVGFEKRFLWNQGGGPAIYLRCSTLYDAQAEYKKASSGSDARPFANAVRDFLTPFALDPFQTRSGAILPPVDYSHEREWRAPAGLAFEYANVKFVIVHGFDDLKRLPEEAVQAIGKDRFLSMSNYQRIEELWPTLHINR